MRFPSRPELAAMMRLALPIVVAQVGMMLMGVVDTIMIGRVSAEALGAVALGNLYFFSASVPAFGTLMVLDPIVSQAAGAGDDEGVALGIQRGALLAVLLTVVAVLLLLPFQPIMTMLRQPPELVALAQPYIRACIPGVLPFLLFVVLRQSLQAIGETRAIVVCILVANGLNVLLNWALIYGNVGSPALGVLGSAIATSVSRWFMTVLLLALAWPLLRSRLRPWRRASSEWAPLRGMLRLGVPIGLMQFLEYGVFSATALLMGLLGARELAAHHIAINLASLTFMVPLGVGAAAAVRVGHAVGADDPRAARESARAALVCGVGFMVGTAVLMIAAPVFIASRYTTDAAVLALAALLIPIAGVFQIFDGVQAVCAGVLRGLGDTRVPFLINLGGFWIAGFPVSIVLGFRTPLGAVGLWWGFVAGLGVVGALLLLRLRRQLAEPLARTRVDGACPAAAATQ